jgi:hypothetical protein
MPERSPAPARLRAADVIAQQQATIAALLNRGGGENSSVSLVRNAKGETQIEVTVRTDDVAILTADAALAKARELYELACQAYPTGSGLVRNEGQDRPTVTA